MVSEDERDRTDSQVYQRRKSCQHPLPLLVFATDSCEKEKEKLQLSLLVMKKAVEDFNCDMFTELTEYFF